MRGRDAFSAYHPAINALFFVTTIGFSMVLMHPVCLLISFFAACTYLVQLVGAWGAFRKAWMVLPLLLLALILNPAFNNQGVTILTYLPSGNPLTLESIAYGAAAGAMLAAVIVWFSCLNEVISSDKLVYLMGRALPSLGLLLSMILRFVPRFRAQLKEVSRAQTALFGAPERRRLASKLWHGLRVLSITVTWALEHGLEMADSMKSRGYGLSGRTAYSIYRLERRDVWLLAAFLLCGALMFLANYFGATYWRYFPSVKGVWVEGAALAAYAIYALICFMPVLLNAREARRWRRLRSAI